MEKRLFGRSGHQSTVAIFGGAAFWEISQKEADKVMEDVIAAGINHIDVAPSYGQAEERIGPWMKRERDRFFLGCKTMERSGDDAWKEMRASLKRLNTGVFDLYQCHAITTFEELDAITKKGGALEAMQEMRDEGLTRYLGITGHGKDAPAIYLEALRRFDFDSVLFPLNFVQMAQPEYRRNAEELIATCKARNVATMAIKVVTKAPWGERKHTATTWYEPFDDMNMIRQAVNFALSYDISGLCTAGDCKILPKIINACENYEPLDQAGREKLIQSAHIFEPLFS